MKTTIGVLRYNRPSKTFIRKITPAAIAFLFVIGLLGSAFPTAAASPDLQIIPITWNVVGLDENDVTRGPNTFNVGARICNRGDAIATNLAIGFFWDNPNPYINLVNPTITEQIFSALSIGSCVDAYFPIVITRDVNAYDSSASYYLAVVADDVNTKYSPPNREIYVERLQASSTLSISSIQGATRVLVGEVYEFVVTSQTAAEDYEQLVHFMNLPENILRLVEVRSRYERPALATNDTLYADACGWDNDVTSPTYRSCIGPPNYITGDVGGPIVTTYTVEVLTTGTVNLVPILYGFNDGDYEYNQDYGADTLSVTAVEASIIGIPIVQIPATPTLVATTPTTTITPTATGTIVANPAMSKVGNRSQLSFGQSLTFTINIRNNGTAPALDVRFSDSLEAYTYLRVSSATTTQGTVSIEGTSGRTVVANLGTIRPNEVVTITFQISVITTPATTQSLFNTATITFEWPEGTTRQTRSATSSVFTVIGTRTLPGTGELPLEAETDRSNDKILLISLSLGGLLFFGLIYWLMRKRAGKGWFWGIGGLLTILAFMAVYTSACQPTQPVNDLQIDLESSELSPDHPAAPTETINPLMTLPAYLFGTPSAIETLPSYPIPSPTLMSESDDGSLPDTSPIVRIVIPSIDVDTKVAYVPFDGHTWMIQGLREEVAWMGDTSWPGLGGNTGLAGHITVRDLGNGPFRYLGDLLQNDVIYLYTENNVYTYSVREKRVVDQADLSVVEPTDSAQITLITCLEWDEDLEIYIKRLAVMADLVRTDTLVASVQD